MHPLSRQSLLTNRKDTPAAATQCHEVFALSVGLPGHATDSGEESLLDQGDVLEVPQTDEL